MSIAWSSASVLSGRREGGDFDLDLGALIDQSCNVEQGGGRKIPPQRLAPGGTNAGARGLVFAAAGQIPGQPDDVLRTGAGLAQQLDDPAQGYSNLSCHIGLIFALLVAAGLAGQDDPAAGTIDLYAVRKAARLRPFGRLQDTHERVLQVLLHVVIPRYCVAADPQ